MAEGRLALARPDEVVVRMYGQGFGDCFLLAFPRLANGQAGDPADPVYVVIDCGIYLQTPGEKKRMRDVVENIATATGGKVDLLVVTHEHYDHLCGFEHAQEVWQTISVGRVWLGWTEDASHPATQGYDQEHQALRLQAELALNVAGAFAAWDPGLALTLSQMEAVVSFAGGVAAGEPGAGAIRPPRKLSKLPDRVLDDLTHNPGARFKPAAAKTQRDFCEPGQVHTVPETGVDAYVLGPPTAAERLAQDFSHDHVYPDPKPEGAPGADTPAAAIARARALAAALRAENATLAAALRHHPAAAAVVGDPPEAANDAGRPFKASLSLPYSVAREQPFFRNTYFRGRRDLQIELEWLMGLNRLALQIDQLVNNTSLVLAFRLSDGRVLLFVGDAQVGNWLSWHELKPTDWRRPDGRPVDFRPTAAELLGRTVLYKVGHHGSHNATVSAQGLEQMPDGLIAFVPASRLIPQKRYGWQIPRQGVLDALWRKSGGRIVFPHEHLDYSYAGTAFEQAVQSSASMFDAMVQDGEVIEAPVPLWRQVRI